MIYDPAREQPTTVSDRPRNPVNVLRDATELYARIKGHNPRVLQVMEMRLDHLEGMERNGVSQEIIARFYYDALVGVGALEIDDLKQYPTVIDTIAAAKHPTPVYQWCKGRYEQYAFEVNDGNPRGLDLSKKESYLAAGRDKLLRMKETERRGSAPDQEDVDFFSDLFASVHAEAQSQFLETLAGSKPADGLDSRVH